MFWSDHLFLWSNLKLSGWYCYMLLFFFFFLPHCCSKAQHKSWPAIAVDQFCCIQIALLTLNVGLGTLSVKAYQIEYSLCFFIPVDRLKQISGERIFFLEKFCFYSSLESFLVSSRYSKKYFCSDSLRRAHFEKAWFDFYSHSFYPF